MIAPVAGTPQGQARGSEKALGQVEGARHVAVLNWRQGASAPAAPRAQRARRTSKPARWRPACMRV
eukprot:scaffold167890_cov19-Tisochrysis_lutea.AAC.1